MTAAWFFSWACYFVTQNLQKLCVISRAAKCICVRLPVYFKLQFGWEKTVLIVCCWDFNQGFIYKEQEYQCLVKASNMSQILYLFIWKLKYFLSDQVVHVALVRNWSAALLIICYSRSLYCNEAYKTLL